MVDFSTPTALSDVLEYCVGNNMKLLVATTGHSDIQNEKIAAAAKKIAVFKTANLSHGVYVLSRLVALAASLLDGFDVNVTETHHKKKLDAPSGTAKMLADVIKSSCVDENTPDVSINSIRGGTAVGKHEISFFGNYETLTLTHEACCKDVYAPRPSLPYDKKSRTFFIVRPVKTFSIIHNILQIIVCSIIKLA